MEWENPEFILLMDWLLNSSFSFAAMVFNRFAE